MSSLLMSMGFLFIGGGASILGTGISPRIWFTSLASESIVASRLIFGAWGSGVDVAGLGWGSGVDVAGPGWGSEVDVPGPEFSVACLEVPCLGECLPVSVLEGSRHFLFLSLLFFGDLLSFFSFGFLVCLGSTSSSE